MPSPILRVLRYLLAVLLGASFVGCASVWVTPTTDESVSTPSAVLARPPRTHIAIPATLAPTQVGRSPVQRPSPTPVLAALAISDALQQSWTDPNDISGLLIVGSDLWAATGGGVVRWHLPTGEYQLYTMQDGLVSQATRGIAEDSEGHIWVAHADHPGWSEYDGTQWRRWNSAEDAVVARYPSLLQARQFDPRLWSIRKEGKWLWMPSFEGGVSAYDGENWYSYDERDGLRRNNTLVVLSSQGRVWAAGEGLSTTVEGDRYWQDHGLFAGVSQDSQVTSIALDEQQGIWLAFAGSQHPGGGLARLDPQANLWTGYTHDLNPLIPQQVYVVQLDAQGTLWACGEQSLAFRHAGDDRWHSIPLPGITAQCFVRDTEGRYWLGTAHGLWWVAATGDEEHGPWLVPSPLLGNQVRALARNGQGQLWIGTPKGVTCITTTTALSGTDTLSGGWGNSAIVTEEETSFLSTSPSGEIWLATRSGLYVLHSNLTRERALADRVIAITYDAAGQPWVCTADGQVKKRGPAGWQGVAVVADLVGSPPRRIALGRDGTLWLATDKGIRTLTPDGQYTVLPAEGLPDTDTRGLALEPDGSLWVATPRGLARYSPTGQWAVYTPESTGGGLRSAEIRDVSRDQEGTLWVSTAAGLSVRSTKADWAYYDLPGLLSICAQPDGALWLGTTGGLYRIRRDALTRAP
jgi:ligand-binding sensor domain-containing protein